MKVHRCPICKLESESGMIDNDIVVEMEVCKDCVSKVKSGEIKIGRNLTRRRRNRIIGKW
jgi:hypothetical protein